MKTLNRRVFIGTTASLAAAAALPALTGSQVLRHGPVDMRMEWMFGPTVLKTELLGDLKQNKLSLVVTSPENEVIRLVMPLDQVATIACQRIPGAITGTRVEGLKHHQTRFKLLLHVEHREGATLCLRDAQEVAQLKSPAVARLRLEDIQAVLPKA